MCGGPYEEVTVSEMSTYINTKDRQQVDPATARYCQKDQSHGRLTVHGSGSAMACLNRVSAPGEKLALCDYGEPISK